MGVTVTLVAASHEKVQTISANVDKVVTSINSLESRIAGRPVSQQIEMVNDHKLRQIANTLPQDVQLPAWCLKVLVPLY